MSRIRTIKPVLFEHEVLFDAEKDSGLPLRLAFIGLFTQCDREGRFIWRPRQLGINILPYDGIEFSRVLDALWTRGFIVKYASDGNEYGCIPSWSKHQVINNREADSCIPSPDDENIVLIKQSDACPTRAPRVKDAWSKSESGREGNGREYGKEENKETRVDDATKILSSLKTTLSEEAAKEVIAYRKRRGEPLTPLAATRLANQLSQWPKPDEAAAEMMLRQWRGFKPEWMNGGGTGPPKLKALPGGQPRFRDEPKPISNEEWRKSRA